MLRAIGVAVLWIVSFPLAILYHLLRRPKAKTFRPGTPAHARMVASVQRSGDSARIAAMDRLIAQREASARTPHDARVIASLKLRRDALRA